MRNSRKEQDRSCYETGRKLKEDTKPSKSEVVGKLDCGCVGAVAEWLLTTLPSSFHAACYVIPCTSTSSARKQGKAYDMVCAE